MSVNTGRLPQRGSFMKGHIAARAVRFIKKCTNKKRRAIDRAATQCETAAADRRSVPATGYAW